MTETIIAQNAPIFVAIDIAKARHEVLIAIPGNKRRRRLTVLNQLDDFKRLITTLASYGFPVQVAFEATGNYHRAIAFHLATAGFEVKLVSSVSLARTREALRNSWDKNDPKDAQGHPSHPPYDGDRKHPVLSRPIGLRHQRHPRAVKNP